MTRGKSFDANRDPDGPRIVEEAASWLLKSTDRPLSALEKDELEAWLDADPRHREAYVDVQRLWEGSAGLPETKTRGRKAKPITRRDVGKGALLLATGTAAAWYLKGRFAGDHVTGIGECKSIVAPDGSRIDLSTQSRLSFFFNDVERRVVLHEGEAYFTVARGLTPFVVAAGLGMTTALGTAFSVEYRDDEARVGVTQHATEVSVGVRRLRVASGQQVRYGTELAQATEQFDPDIALRWRQGQLTFSHQPLGEVVRVLNLWRRGYIVVPDRALAARPISLVVDVSRSGQIAGQLAAGLPLKSIEITRYFTLLLPLE